MLFEELGLSPPPSATKHTRKQISTKAEVLQDLSMEHPLPAIILQHRKLSKLLFGFSQHLVKWVVPGENQDLSRYIMQIFRNSYVFFLVLNSQEKQPCFGLLSLYCLGWVQVVWLFQPNCNWHWSPVHGRSQFTKYSKTNNV